jgi:mRNA interferase MazF
MKQGEIWLINLNPSVGAEIKKTRPAIVVNDNSLANSLEKIKNALSLVLTIQ